MAKVTPKLVEVAITASRSGDVAIRSYGNVKSGYFVSYSRKYDVTGMNEDDAMEFQRTVQQQLDSELEAIDDAMYTERYEQSYLKARDDRMAAGEED